MAYTNEPVKKVEKPVDKGPGGGNPRPQNRPPQNKPPWTTLKN